MIENQNVKPTYVPRGQKAFDAEIASKQIAKAASAEVVAMSAASTANFVLRKATESLEASKVAYFAAIEKSAWNLDVLKASYNNALAGFRDAEIASQVASEELARAKSVLSGLRKKAKMDNDDDSSDDDYSGDDSSEDEYEYEKAMVTNPKIYAVTANEEGAADAMAGTDPKAAADALSTLADTHERLSGMARQAGDISAHSAHAAEAGRLRAKSIIARAHANNKETFKSAADFVGKRAFSDEKRDELAAKGHALPDGSFPIETKGDISNAVQSVGRAKDYDAAKAHIIDRAKDLDAVDTLPDDWKVSKAVMLIMCPSCMGGGCDGCDNGAINQSDLGDHLGDVVDSGDQMPIAMSAFSTDSLLTRDFEKSVAYQEYILAKGDVDGHEFHGNQYTSGTGGGGVKNEQNEARKIPIDPKQVPQVRDPKWNPRTSGPLINMPRVGMQRGFNDVIREYKASFDAHLKNSDKATADAKAAVAKGDLETAAQKAQKAVDELANAVQAGRGVFFTHQKFEGKFPQADASENSEAMSYRKQARDIADNKIPLAEDFANKIIAAYKQSESAKDAATKIVGL